MKMKTNNTEGLSPFEINLLIQQGAKFVMFPYLSGLVKKFKNSNIYFVRPGERTLKYAFKHFFMNANLSLDNIPYWPVNIFKSAYFLVAGGKDYTFTILEDINRKSFYNTQLYDLYDLCGLQEL